jgi:predicted RNA-binding Zn ribbon-like protein
MTSKPPASEGLELVRGFVNTADLEDGTNELATPSLLAQWLAERGIAAGEAPPTEDERLRVIEVREALRALLFANNGEPLDTAAVETLNRAAGHVALSLRFGADGRPDLTPQGGGIDRALGTILAIVFASMADGSWARLKACRADTCQWAFYDQSRNRSGQWCSMAVCGNRAKARTYRHRHKPAGKRPG